MSASELEQKLTDAYKDMTRYKQENDRLQHKLRTEQRGKHLANVDAAKFESLYNEARARVSELESELARVRS